MVTGVVAMLDIFAMTQCVFTVHKVDTWICKYWMLAAVMSAHHECECSAPGPSQSAASDQPCHFPPLHLLIHSVTCHQCHHIAT